MSGETAIQAAIRMHCKQAEYRLSREVKGADEALERVRGRLADRGSLDGVVSALQEVQASAGRAIAAGAALASLQEIGEVVK